MRSLLTAAVLAITISAPTRAEPPAPPFSPEALLSGIVHESDVTLVFSYVREAFRAALQGREARPPYELQQRAETIAEALKQRGVIAAEIALDEIERNIREEMRRPPLMPPSSSRQRL